MKFLARNIVVAETDSQFSFFFFHFSFYSSMLTNGSCFAWRIPIAKWIWRAAEQKKKLFFSFEEENRDCQPVSYSKEWKKQCTQWKKDEPNVWNVDFAYRVVVSHLVVWYPMQYIRRTQTVWTRQTDNSFIFNFVFFFFYHIEILLLLLLLLLMLLPLLWLSAISGKIL